MQIKSRKDATPYKARGSHFGTVGQFPSLAIVECVLSFEGDENVQVSKW